MAEEKKVEVDPVFIPPMGIEAPVDELILWNSFCKIPVFVANFVDTSVHVAESLKIQATVLAICLAKSGGTAFPTWVYCSVRGPSKK